MKENIILSNLRGHGFFLKLKSSRLSFCNEKKKNYFLVIFKWSLPLTKDGKTLRRIYLKYLIAGLNPGACLMRRINDLLRIMYILNTPY